MDGRFWSREGAKFVRPGMSGRLRERTAADRAVYPGILQSRGKAPPQIRRPTSGEPVSRGEIPDVAVEPAERTRYPDGMPTTSRPSMPAKSSGLYV